MKIKQIVQSMLGKKKNPVDKEHVVDPEFNKDLVFEDTEFVYRPINIKTILSKYDSSLLKLKTGSYFAFEWIDNICRKFNINPKLILSMLELRKPGIVTSKRVLPRKELDTIFEFGATDYGVSPMFDGFDKQLFYAAMNYRKSFDLYYIKKGVKVKCMDGGEVSPENASTYAMYMTNPYIGTHDYFKVRPVTDKEGTIIGTEQDLKYKAPFGVYGIWRIWKRGL